ncbi:MAG TPA: type I restriction-modification system subunit M N-terminal domain-containing protein [Gemmatimonadaceae bacterium]
MFEQTFKNIDDVLRQEAGCTTELDYTEQAFSLLFLKYLGGLEEEKSAEATLSERKHSFILDTLYRWMPFRRFAPALRPDGDIEISC